MSSRAPCGCGAATCGCCAGIAVLTPRDVFNRPGLATLRYRIGTHGSFLASMKARLSSHKLTGGDNKGARPLAALRTRNSGDASIALLDAWAIIGDVLTFYQERIANEGYLRTATELRSLYALARLIGYTPRPGVAASVYLSYTIDKPPLPAPGTAPQPAETVVPKGARVQTVPDQDELPQSFETSEDLLARAAWNRLGVRRREPQQAQRVLKEKTLYLAGTQTRLKVGDPLLIAVAPNGDAARPEAYRIVEVAEDADAGRTLVRFQRWSASPAEAAAEAAAATAAATPPPLPAASFADNIGALARPPSQPLANALQLRRSLATSFEPTGDAALQVLAKAAPQLRPTLDAAIAGYQGASPPQVLEVYAFRLQAGLFASRTPKRTRSQTDKKGVTISEVVGEWPVVEIFIHEQPPVAVEHEKQQTLHLDAAYDGIVPGSWVLVDTTGVESLPRKDQQPQTMVQPKQAVLVAQIGKVFNKASRADYGIVADSVGIALAGKDRWFDYEYNVTDLPREKLQALYDRDFRIVRRTSVYARSERLALAEVPIDTDICADVGTPLELDALYLDLEPGRFVIVGGERADIPATEGVFACEAAMITRVVHDVATDVRESTAGGVRRLPLTEAAARAHVTQLTAPAPLAGDRTHSFVWLDKPLAYCYRRGTVQVHGNVVRATHGESRVELLGNGDGARQLQSFTLKQSPVTFLAAPTPAGAASTLELYVDDIRWHAATSFVGAGPRDAIYLARTDAKGVTTVTFGNGKQGARLPTGLGNVTARYRNGIGRVGNARANQISQLATRPLGVREVINPLRAAGGADPESVAQIRRNAPLAVMALDRLVSTRDYADFARTFAGIGKADAQELSDRRRSVVHLTVAGSDDIPIDPGSELMLNLRRVLADFGDPFQPVVVAARDLWLLVVEAKLRIHPDHRWERVVTDVRAALLGYFSFDARELGQGAASSEVLGVIQSVAGVVYADLDVFGAIPTLDFDAGGSRPRTPAQIAVSVQAAIAVGVAPKVDAARAHAAGGILRPAQLMLLTPEVPATLVLNQIV